MAKRISESQLHDLVGQQTQGPVVMSSGRWGAGGGNQMGALLVRQFRRFSRARSIAQRGFDAFFDTSFAGWVDHGGGHGQGFDNLRILQPAAAFSSPGLSLRALRTCSLAQHGFQHFDFVICQRDTILLMAGMVVSAGCAVPVQRLCLLSVQIMRLASSNGGLALRWP